MGGDAFLGLTTWKEWRNLFELANIAVAHRPGYQLEQDDALNDELRLEFQNRQTSQISTTAAGSILLSPMTPLDISATAIRSALQSRHSARYLLPDPVLDYIQKNSLYL